MENFLNEYLYPEIETLIVKEEPTVEEDDNVNSKGHIDVHVQDERCKTQGCRRKSKYDCCNRSLF